MATTRFIHTADWQLGMTRHFLGADAQPRYTAARIDALRTIGMLTRDQDCSFVVVCGDVFESNHIDRQILVRALDAMSDVQAPLYLLPGNHDPLDAGSIYRSPTFRQHVPDNVQVLDSFEPVEASPGVWLLPAPWSSKRPLEDLTARALQRADETSGVRVMVAHGIVDCLSPDATDPALIELGRLEQATGDERLHFAALGDRHSVTEVGSSGRVWYSGAPEVTDYDEVDPGQVLVVELDSEGGAASVKPHRVGEWLFVRQMLSMNSVDDIDRLAAELDAREAKDKTVLKLGFEGTLSVRDKARLDRLLEHHGDLYASIQLWRRKTELAVMPKDTDFEDLGLTGFVQEALEELRRASERPDDDGVVAQDALALLVRLAGDHSA